MGESAKLDSPLGNEVGYRSNIQENMALDIYRSIAEITT
jgi:hypothetical protein